MYTYNISVELYYIEVNVITFMHFNTGLFLL